jgi:hypothetical protein
MMKAEHKKRKHVEPAVEEDRKKKEKRKNEKKKKSRKLTGFPSPRPPLWPLPQRISKNNSSTGPSLRLKTRERVRTTEKKQTQPNSTSNQARLPAEFKHINKRRRRN